ncbi:MAG: Uncharacterised protein [Formosa sp. Hel1_33_131]|nr:MAG: Uncharacterised protein [Formosa sp. Hel1_33_131]
MSCLSGYCSCIFRMSVLKTCIVSEVTLDASIKYKTTCDCVIFSNVFLMPILSMVSSVVRMPAVSINRNLIPSIVISSSIASRVVPAMSLTMALSSFKSAFKSVDFPTFGAPIIEIGMPFLITFPVEKESIKCFKTLIMRCSNSSNCLRSANSTSSSEKSSSNSMSDAKFNNSSRKALISLLNPPRICCMAIWCAALLSLAIRSATASA